MPASAGTPGIVERALVCPPRSQIGPITAEQRQQIIRDSVVAGVYEKVVDRESAYERLQSRFHPLIEFLGVQAAVPAFTPTLHPGRQHGPGEDPYLDITRLTTDTGYQPTYNTTTAVADYINWRRTNPR